VIEAETGERVCVVIAGLFIEVLFETSLRWLIDDLFVWGMLAVAAVKRRMSVA
jgi:hypothetical protein